MMSLISMSFSVSLPSYSMKSETVTLNCVLCSIVLLPLLFDVGGSAAALPSKYTTVLVLKLKSVRGGCEEGVRKRSMAACAVSATRQTVVDRFGQRIYVFRFLALCFAPTCSAFVCSYSVRTNVSLCSDIPDAVLDLEISNMPCVVSDSLSLSLVLPYSLPHLQVASLQLLFPLSCCSFP